MDRLQVGLRVMNAVVKKDLLIFVRYPSWVIAVFIWPLLFPIMAVFSAKALAGPDEQALHLFGTLAGTTDYTAYIIVGVVLWMWLNMMLWTLGGFLRSEQMRGTLESTWLCPVSRLGVLVGATVSQMITSMANFAVMVVAARFVWGFQIVGDLRLAAALFVLSSMSVYGLGILFASLVIWFKEMNAMVQLVRGLFMVFCGLTYPLAVLPAWMRGISRALPLTYSIEAIRAVALSGADAAAVSGHILALSAFGVGTLTIGVSAFRYTERRMTRTGALGHH
jgi:ABC-2 type transport system permease protein